MLPAVVYGHGSATVPISVDAISFVKLLKTSGDSSLFDMHIEGDEPFKVLIQDYQNDPLSHTFLHVDFYRIRMDEKLHTEIPLTFIGEPPALKVGGVLIKPREKLNISCFPKDLVSEIRVNIFSLAAVRDAIKIKDLTLPQGIEVREDPQTILASIAAQQEEIVEVSKEQEKAVIDELGKKEEKPETKEQAEKNEKKEKKA